MKNTKNVISSLSVLGSCRIIDIAVNEIPREVRETLIYYLTSYLDSSDLMGEDLYRLDDWQECLEKLPDCAPGIEIIKRMHLLCKRQNAAYVRLVVE
jgi:hypothetical protein